MRYFSGHAGGRRLTIVSIRLSAALSDAERYEEAYQKLRNAFEAILSRNESAEQEADALSQINADLLGHTNHGQKIHYVDRIRKELDQARRDLVMSRQERESAMEAAKLLQDELDAYKSVDLDAREKAGTGLKRVSRAPLGAKPVNGPSRSMGHGLAKSTAAPANKTIKAQVQQQTRPLTLEDLM